MLRSKSHLWILNRSFWGNLIYIYIVVIGVASIVGPKNNSMSLYFERPTPLAVDHVCVKTAQFKSLIREVEEFTQLFVASSQKVTLTGMSDSNQKV